jgi:hypothetical protein
LKKWPFKIRTALNDIIDEEEDEATISDLLFYHNQFAERKPFNYLILGEREILQEIFDKYEFPININFIIDDLNHDHKHAFDKLSKNNKIKFMNTLYHFFDVAYNPKLRDIIDNTYAAYGIQLNVKEFYYRNLYPPVKSAQLRC